jgi:cob(I)alamin adenosyltransferase
MSSSIYTRTGDRGETSLADSSRVPKDSLRVEAYGTVDEANSWVGLARAFAADPLLAEVLDFVQHRLFNCSSNLASPPGTPWAVPTIDEADIALLEHAIDRFETATGPLTRFVLPGGAQGAAALHVARTVVRRAERRIVSLSAHEGGVDPLVQKFVNRASDLLFAAARYANNVDGRTDVTWDKARARPDLELGSER